MESVENKWNKVHVVSHVNCQEHELKKPTGSRLSRSRRAAGGEHPEDFPQDARVRRRARARAEQRTFLPFFFQYSYVHFSFLDPPYYKR